MLQGTGDTLISARSLRREMSPPEVRLWQALRARPRGLKFRRQHPSGPYIADFYCHSARLIIEVDGEAHNRGDRPQRDVTRDQWFETRQLRVMRVPATDVLRDCDAVVRWIVAIVGKDQGRA